MRKYYRCKYSFNALHSMDGLVESAHSHTFTLHISVAAQNKTEMFEFHEFEDIVKNVLNHFSGQFLNKMNEFKKMIPTIENIGDVLYDTLKQSLEKKHYVLYRLEIGENPLAEYSVSEEFLLPMEYLADCKGYWEQIIERKIF